jgi:hypothetical protein
VEQYVFMTTRFQTDLSKKSKRLAEIFEIPLTGKASGAAGADSHHDLAVVVSLTGTGSVSFPFTPLLSFFNACSQSGS